MKTKGKVLLSSIASIALCSSIAVGGTFALFTSESTVNIAVTSGKVNVVASVDSTSLTTSSMGVAQTAGEFANGGTAKFTSTSALNLSLVSPGDKAEFNVNVTNNSNIAIQYRAEVTVTGGLADVLDCSVTSTTWTYVEAGKEISPLEVVVEFTAGREDINYNNYQGIEDTNVSVIVYAVQANAFTGGTVIEDTNENVILEDVLNDLNANENIVINVSKANLTWETGAGHGSTPFGNDTTKSVTIIGESPEFSKLTATGAGVGSLRVEDGTLTVKNVEIIDETVSYAEDSWEFGYLEIGETNEDTLVFENCVFNKAIQITGNATFKNCSFNSNADNEYAVWVNGGNATFENCKFTGPRGLKMHEDYGSEVESVTVNLCTFENLTKKPGVAIGDLNANTTVTIKNSTFINCQAGDQGLLIYESDTEVTTFNFTMIANEVYKEEISTNKVDTLQAALSNSNKVVLTENVANNNETVSNGYGATAINMTNNGVIDGNGNTLTTTGCNNTWDSAIHTTGGTIKNLTLQGGFRGIFISGSLTSDIIIDKVSIDGVCYAINSDGYPEAANEYKLIVTNSIINGWTSWSQNLSVVEFTNCTFGAGNGTGYG